MLTTLLNMSILNLVLEAEVYHHMKLIWKWIEEGRIKPTKEVKEEIAYHDSCYIGRYTGL